jgi:hypothetical protein
MNAREFREALHALGLPLTAPATAALLGVTTSALCKYAYGHRPVHGGIARALALLVLLTREGVTPAEAARRLGLELSRRHKSEKK